MPSSSSSSSSSSSPFSRPDRRRDEVLPPRPSSRLNFFSLRSQGLQLRVVRQPNDEASQGCRRRRRSDRQVLPMQPAVVRIRYEARRQSRVLVSHFAKTHSVVVKLPDGSFSADARETAASGIVLCVRQPRRSRRLTLPLSTTRPRSRPDTKSAA